ncbi:hypothetical protein CVT91_04625 [Candidatus Atribacteria bacterium HGW-Atribacteria-1]|nr:MAG: hypothetical protein CVT91_04625 [Candidatus Atribacteria bacterium HGW-Atribacteria-1]
MKYRKVIFISLLLLLLSFTCLLIFAQGVGYIQIKCEPGAIVFLDNNFVGNTSLEQVGLILQDVPAGSYVIKIVKEGFEPQSVKIDLKVNEIYVYEVKEFIPQLDVTQEGEADTDTIKQRVGSILIETIPIDCIIEIPKLNINKEHYGNKTKKTWEISNIPIESYKVNFIALGKKIEYELKIEEGIKKHLLVNVLNNEVKELAPQPLTIGDIGSAGGLIFYDKGSYSDGWRYLEAAPKSTEWNKKQWDDRYVTGIAGIETGIGTGQSNTTIIIARLNSDSKTGMAAQLCDALVYGGYSDWFLPSLDELNLMYENLYLKGIGGFTDNSYWSSSADAVSNAWSQDFSNGDRNNKYLKYSHFSVRAVRAF